MEKLWSATVLTIFFSIILITPLYSYAQEPPVITEFTYSVVSGTQIDLSWTVNDNNSMVTDFQIYRNLNGAGFPPPALPTFEIDDPLQTSFSDMTLSPGDTVYYNIRAVSSDEGEGPFYGVQASVTTLEDEKNNGGDNQWDKRPTFGISHETRQGLIVENGFSFNGESFAVTDNHHTDFEEQLIEVGSINSFSATVYADKKLKVQEFLFGIPTVGESHLAEVGLEVWYSLDGEIENVIVSQDTEVIDEDTLSIIHEKVNCTSTDDEKLCDRTTASMKFLEPLQHQVMAIKAIDHKNRDQITHLNDGFDIFGESLNPMLSKTIPSNEKHQGLLKVTQTEKYSPYWVSEDQRMFEMNSFGSFKEINHKFERFADQGNVKTRTHSDFVKILEYEQDRAQEIYNSIEYSSDIQTSFTYIYPESGKRTSEEFKQQMNAQEDLAKTILEQMNKQTRFH